MILLYSLGRIVYFTEQNTAFLTHANWIMIGLFLSLCGDILLTLRATNSGILGGIAFMGAHISYCIGFSVVSWKVTIEELAAIIIISLIVNLIVAQRYRTSVKTKLSWFWIFFLETYFGFVLTMVTYAFNFEKQKLLLLGASLSSLPLIFIGAIFFLISDFILIVGSILNDFIPHGSALVLVFYYSAQTCITFGFIPQ